MLIVCLLNWLIGLAVVQSQEIVNVQVHSKYIKNFLKFFLPRVLMLFKFSVESEAISPNMASFSVEVGSFKSILRLILKTNKIPIQIIFNNNDNNNNNNSNNNT